MALSPRAAGIALNICGQVLQNVAALLMSHGQQNRAAMSHTYGLVGRKHPAWLVGIALLVVGALAVFASYGAAEQSLLSSLISAQFVSNVIFGRLFFGRQVTENVLGGTAVIIFGTTICIMTTPRLEADLDEEDLWQLCFHNPSFLKFGLFGGLLWCLVNAVHDRYVAASEPFLARDGALGSAEALPPQPMAHADLALPLCYVARAAMPGSLSIIAAKSLAILLRLAAAGKSSLFSPLLWMSLVAWLCGTGFWLRRMNGALTKFDGAFVIPLCQVIWSFCTIVTGGFFYHEFEHFAWWQLLLFVIGACLNFFGASMLRPAPSDFPNGDGPDFELLVA